MAYLMRVRNQMLLMWVEQIKQKSGRDSIFMALHLAIESFSDAIFGVHIIE